MLKNTRVIAVALFIVSCVCSASAGELKNEDDCSWVYSEHSGPHEFIRVFDPISLDEANAAINLVAQRLIPGEYIWKVYQPEKIATVDGNIVSEPLSGIVAVSLGTGKSSGGREMAVASTDTGFVVSDLGRRSH
ncbi:MAG: hypothetical protein ACI9ON_004330 [Limisphaerales bacterium]|jgi:hypothetical protein